MTRVELLTKFRGNLCFERSYKGFSVPNILLDCFAVIVVVGKCSMYLGRGQLRIVRYDLRHRIAQTLMPEGNILHADTMTGNPGFPAAGAGSRNDVFHTGRRVVRFVSGSVCFHTVYHTQELSYMPTHLT